jgi:membrane-associated phospholipid phosphatase
VTGTGVLLLAGAGAVVLGGSFAGARLPEIHPLERQVFGAVNRLPDWLQRPLWVPMQLGNLAVGTAVGLAVALGWRDGRLAVAVLLAAALKLVGERVVRHRMAPYLAVRQRPGTSQPGAIVRGSDVPTVGPSFPSGHVILVAAVASVVAHDVPLAWAWLPPLAVLLVMVGRVYVGAHNPLDVAAGLGAGLLVGSLVRLIVY